MVTNRFKIRIAQLSVGALGCLALVAPSLGRESTTPRAPETASVTSSQPDSAILLIPEHALLLRDAMKGPALRPQLLPMPDVTGIPDSRVIAPVAPADGSLVWILNVPKAGRYLVTLEFAHLQEGNAFEISVDGQVLSGFAPDTRGGLALLELGGLNLAAGRQTLLLKNKDAVGKTFMSVGAIYLRPVAQSWMTRPQIRAAIAQLKPRRLPTDLILPSLFSDHMVLQRNMLAPVWGWAKPSSLVTVRFRGQDKQVKADASGHWMVVLDPMEAGGPDDMEVGNGNQPERLKDILVGEVWFGSGQSNMEVAAKFLPKSAGPEHPYECDEDTRQLLEKGINPQIRISAITRDHWNEPRWSLLSRDTILEAPALMTGVAILLREKLNVPVGIIIRCESSSTSGLWLSRDAVEEDMEIQQQLRDYAAHEYPKLVADYPAQLAAWEAAAAKAKAAGVKLPVKPAAPTLPGGMPVNRGFEGNVFFSEGRFEHYGVNYAARIEPVLPYAVRGIVWDQGENGTGIAGADQLAVMPALVRSWRQAWDRPDLPFLYLRKNQHPATLATVLAKLGNTVQVDNRGLSQINHPPDKASYARRVVEQMHLHLYSGRNLVTPGPVGDDTILSKQVSR